MANKNYDSFGGNERVVSTPIAPWELRLDWSATDGRWRYTVYGDEPHPDLKRTGEMINVAGLIVNSHILTITGRDEDNTFRLSSNFIRTNGAYQMFHVSKKFKRGAGKRPHRYSPGSWKEVEGEIKADGMNGQFTRIIAAKVSSCEAQPWNPDAKKNDKAVKLSELYINAYMTITGWSWRDGFQKSAREAGLHELNVESLFIQNDMAVFEKVQFGQKVKVKYPLFKFPSLGDLARKNEEKADALYEMGKTYQASVNQFLDDSAEFFSKIADREYKDADDDKDGYNIPGTEEDDVPDQFKSAPADEESDEEGDPTPKTKTQRALEKREREKKAKEAAEAEVEKIEATDDEGEEPAEDSGEGVPEWNELEDAF